jgi:serine/threonine protein kinase
MYTVAYRTTPEDLQGYELCGELAHGGFGDVWRARNGSGKLFALKFIPYANSSAASEEIRSIQMVKQLRHRGLVLIDKVWCCAGYLVIAMELADGSLTDMARAYKEEFQSPIPADYVCYLLLQAATAIDFLNSHRHLIRGRCVGFQHCDIKPSNLLVFGEMVKLCDFGLTTTVTSTFKNRRPAGTPDYSAPEVVLGRISEATDQFSLAVTYCELRGDKLPFPSMPEVYSRSYTRPAPDLSMVTAAERPILQRALAPNPPDRWPTCTAFMTALEDAIPQPSTTRPVQRRHY